MPQPSFSPEVLDRAKRIRALILDVDGVLTDGRIIYAEHGDELKHFNVQDGAGLVFWSRLGLKAAIISCRKSKLMKRRAKEIRVKQLVQGKLIKGPVYAKIVKAWKLSDAEVCVIADDVMELAMVRRAGLAAAVPNAAPDILEHCHYVTQKQGGQGAVREVIELILRAKGLWEDVLAHYS